MLKTRPTSVPRTELTDPHARHPLRRSVIRLAAVCLAFGCVALVVFSDTTHARFVLIRGLDFVHSHLDILSEAHPIDFGPELSSSAESLSSTEISKVLSDYDVELNIEQPEVFGPPSIPFGHESVTAERVVEFKKLLPFDPSQAESVFELSQQLRSLTDHGETSLPDVGTDPVEYLRFAISGQPLTCRYFAILLGATARTQGYTTRLLALTSQGNSREHAVCEIYVPQFAKWVVLDPDFNVAYQRHGEWLDARQLHEAWQQFKQSLQKSHQALEELDNPAEEVLQRTGVEVVELGLSGGTLRQTNMYDGSPTGINLELYEFVLYSIRNDYLSAEYPLGHPIRSREYVLQDAKDQGPPPIAPEAYVIEDISQVYWPVGRTQIIVESCSPGSNPEIGLRFGTWTPNFDCFEVRLDQDQWQRVSDSRFRHKLKIGDQQIAIRSLNLAGLRGEVSELTIQLTHKEE